MTSSNNDVTHSTGESADPGSLQTIHQIDFRLASLAEPKERASLFLQKAVCYESLGRFNDSKTQLELALLEMPGNEEIQLQANYIGAAIYHQEQQFEEAYTRMTRILSQYSSLLSHPNLRFIYEDIQQYRAFELVQLLRFEEALPLLHDILAFEMKPDDKKTAIANLGICYSRVGKYEQAVDYLLEALRLGLPSDWEGQARCQLGIAYAHLRLLREAKLELLICVERASAYQLPLATVYGWLSRVCRGLGQTNEAERYAKLARPS
jgi:tetratricopeptide (TPR) repeat protein